MAVAVHQRGQQTAISTHPFHLSLAKLGLHGTQKGKDLWTGKDVTLTDNMPLEIASHDILLVRIAVAEVGASLRLTAQPRHTANQPRRSVQVALGAKPAREQALLPGPAGTCSCSRCGWSRRGETRPSRSSARSAPVARRGFRGAFRCATQPGFHIARCAKACKIEVRVQFAVQPHQHIAVESRGHARRIVVGSEQRGFVSSPGRRRAASCRRLRVRRAHGAAGARLVRLKVADARSDVEHEPALVSAIGPR